MPCECARRCAESNKHSDEKLNERKKQGDFFQALFKQTSVANETSGGKIIMQSPLFYKTIGQ